MAMSVPNPDDGIFEHISGEIIAGGTFGQKGRVTLKELISS
jgi:hypothetical protein